MGILCQVGNTRMLSPEQRHHSMPIVKPNTVAEYHQIIGANQLQAKNLRC